ncbi:MAG: response regulator [Oscillospiraceae bacterium]|nr:response regulator [Oscillospiraceae bacterium]
MGLSFGEALRRLRLEKGLSQQRLSELLFVDRSTVVRWETGSRLPDALLIARIAQALGVDVSVLLGAAAEKAAEKPAVIMVDDERIILAGGMPVLEEVLPDAAITGFTRPSEALAFARENRVALAFLDIEMGKTSGLDLCRELLAIHPRTNVIFLTAYREYSFDAWETGACGFLLKPISAESVRKQLSHLRYPYGGLA